MKKLFFVLAIAMASVFAASAQVANTELVEGMKYKEIKHLYNHKDYVETNEDRYTPVGSGIASFFIPGLGQMISREVGRGFAWFGGAVASYAVTGIGNAFSVSGTTLGNPGLTTTGSVITLVGAASLLAVEVCSIIDAVKVAKVKNMYEQDLRKKTAFNFDCYPSVNFVQTANGAQPTAGLTFALKF